MFLVITAWREPGEPCVDVVHNIFVFVSSHDSGCHVFEGGTNLATRFRLQPPARLELSLCLGRNTTRRTQQLARLVHTTRLHAIVVLYFSDEKT